MDEQKASILEFIALRQDWRALYADLKRGFVGVPRTEGLLRELGIEAVRMNHVRLISNLREMVKNGDLMREPIRNRAGGRAKFEYALSTKNLTTIRPWEWAPERVIARLSGLNRRLSDEEYEVFELARQTLAETPVKPEALEFIDGSIPSVPLEVRYRRLLNLTYDPQSRMAIRDEIYADERLREDEAMVLAATANVLIRKSRGTALV